MFRVLIVEDEERWYAAMQRNLEDAVQDIKLSGVHCQIAKSLDSALDQLLSAPWSLVSLDMRIPRAQGALVQAIVGKQLADDSRTRHALGKFLIYSATLSVELADFDAHEAMLVSALGVEDKFGKAGKSSDSAPEGGFQPLTPYDWSRRVLAYLAAETRQLSDGHPTDQKRTSVGAWLERAPSRLPPMLARLAQELANAWDDKGMSKVDAALPLIEAASTLALTQTLVVLHAALGRSAGFDYFVPQDDRQVSVLDQLDELVRLHATELSRWNWSGWLTPEVMQAFREANQLRNDLRHTFQALNARSAWARLLPTLRPVMDLCSYWAMHPIYTDLQYSRSGWRAQSLASTAWPTPIETLTPDADFPVDAANAGRSTGDPYWQGVYRRDNEQQPWQHQAVHWGDWLLRDDPEPGAWLLQWQRPGARGANAIRVNLVDGKRRACHR